jgi:hypothetical protein
VVPKGWGEARNRAGKPMGVFHMMADKGERIKGLTVLEPICTYHGRTSDEIGDPPQDRSKFCSGCLNRVRRTYGAILKWNLKLCEELLDQKFPNGDLTKVRQICRSKYVEFVRLPMELLEPKAEAKVDPFRG